ncbi:hypothetical protein NDU88_000700 [Pleurodeles waltl]|uniref:Uncharacterized protein n=1 Tax=Pleurodeles waltl TaxID=8319 RepID=A0AAV7VUA0_PLEWA|nr:hypothetical protein NDU88_000700 [Pleurodeles waltl]
MIYVFSSKECPARAREASLVLLSRTLVNFGGPLGRCVAITPDRLQYLMHSFLMDGRIWPPKAEGHDSRQQRSPTGAKGDFDMLYSHSSQAHQLQNGWHGSKVDRDTRLPQVN